MKSSLGPFDISVFDVAHRIGEERTVTVTVPAPERWGEGVATVETNTPIELEVRAEGLHDGVLVTGTVDTRATAECVRCLEALDLPLRVEFQELFAYSPTEELEYSVHDNHVNCEPLVRDAVVLELPFQPLCDEDCLGLDPETGEKLTEPRAANQPTIDPRWAALEGFSSDTQTPADTPATKKRT